MSGLRVFVSLKSNCATTPASTRLFTAHDPGTRDRRRASSASAKSVVAISAPLLTGPSLDVALDEDKMTKYERYYAEKRDYCARFHQEPRRPDWYPVVGGM